MSFLSRISDFFQSEPDGVNPNIELDQNPIEAAIQDEKWKSVYAESYETFRPKTIAEAEHNVAIWMNRLSTLASIFTVLAAAVYVTNLISHLSIQKSFDRMAIEDLSIYGMSSEYFPPLLLALLSLCLLEAIKRAAVNEIVIGFLKKKTVHILLLVLILALSSTSIFTSLEGSANIAQMKVPPPSLVSIDSIVNYYDETLNELKRDKNLGKTMRYNKVIIGDGRAIIKGASEQAAVVREDKKKAIEDAELENATRKSAHSKEVGFNIWVFVIFFFMLEASVIFGKVWYQRYLYRCAIEFRVGQPEEESSVSQDEQQPNPISFTPTPSLALGANPVEAPIGYPKNPLENPQDSVVSPAKVPKNTAKTPRKRKERADVKANKAAIEATVNSLKDQGEKITIRRVAEITGIGTKTVSKYIKNYI